MSYAFWGVSVGANVKAAYRDIPTVFATGQSAFSVMADIGLLTRFNLFKFYSSREPNLSVGTAVKNLGPYVLGEPLPTYWTSGISYSPIRPVLVAFDVLLPFSFDPANFPAERWFLAGGVDVAVTDFLSVQAGFRYKPASPRLSLGSSVELDNISIVANYVVDFNSDPRFSVEAKLDLGDSGRAETRARVDELYVRGLDAYARGDSQVAIGYWEEALELDPDFTPARTNVDLVRNLLRLQESIEGIQIGN